MLVDIAVGKLAEGETTQGGQVPGDRYWYGGGRTGLGLPISHVKHPFYAVYDAFCRKPAGVRNRKILDLIEGAEEGEEIVRIHLTIPQIYNANSRPEDRKVGQASKISSRQPQCVDVGEIGKAPIAVMTEAFIVLNRVAVVVNTFDVAR